MRTIAKLTMALMVDSMMMTITMRRMIINMLMIMTVVIVVSGNR